MTIQENVCQKVGRNNLEVPRHLINSIIVLKPVQTFSINITKPFNCLYTLWKPSHFFTGLEVHSKKCSWRTFRLNKKIFTAVRMYLSGDHLIVKVFANRKLSKEQLIYIQQHIKRSYGLDERYKLPKKIVATNEYVRNIFSKLRGTRISCPENIFEISIVSLLLQNTNISRTTTMFKKLIERYGRLVMFDQMSLYTFYSPDDLLSVSEDELKEYCRLGYRAKYIKNYADFFSKNDESELRKLSKDNLLTLLETIKGVGTYTSNIVASSALRDTKAIPFDAWNRKILASRLYAADPDDTDVLKIRINNDFGEYAGLIAMYVIENEYINNPVVPLLNEN
jgi:3-methyladenine DNA glycosylase/8-oxoguanine DNA glycosylase